MSPREYYEYFIKNIHCWSSGMGRLCHSSKLQVDGYIKNLLTATSSQTGFKNRPPSLNCEKEKPEFVWLLPPKWVALLLTMPTGQNFYLIICLMMQNNVIQFLFAGSEKNYYFSIILYLPKLAPSTLGWRPIVNGPLEPTPMNRMRLRKSQE